MPWAIGCAYRATVQVRDRMARQCQWFGRFWVSPYQQTVGVETNTIAAEFLREKYGGLVSIKEYGKFSEAAAEMLAGRLDLVFGYSIALQKVPLKNSDAVRLEFVGPDYRMPDWPGIRLVVRKGDDKLREALNAAISATVKDGTYQAVQSKYFTYGVQPVADEPAAVVAAVTVAPLGEAATSFTGAWKCTAEETDDSPRYPVTLNLSKGEQGEVCGTVQYPSLNCSGNLICGAPREREAEYVEKITSGREFCVDNGTVRMKRSNADAAEWQWFFPDGRLGAYATLTAQ